LRCAIAQKQGDISKFPQPPYEKDMEFDDYPMSFSLDGFTDVVKKFNTNFPSLNLPRELIDLRNAMARGLVIEINNDGIDRLINLGNKGIRN